jgi:glycosyltransferase involved in cell wall biosynthesis
VLFDYVAATLVTWGGIEQHIATLGKVLAAKGHEPVLVLRAAYTPDLVERWTEAGIRCVTAPALVPGVVTASEAVADSIRPPLHRWAPALLGIMRRERPDIYHMHSNLHGSEIPAALLARAAGIRPVVCTYHCLLGPETKRRVRGMRALHRSLGVHGVAVSRIVRDMIANRYEPPKNRLTHVANGSHPVDEHLLDGTLQMRTGPTIGVVARLEPPKGVDVFIRALAMIDPSLPWRAEIIGDGPEGPSLRQLAAQFGVSDRVTFRGYLPSAGRLLGAFDLVVIPSRLEGFGIAAVEAAAAGRATIATHVGGLPDVVRPGETGWLVPSEDPAAMARAVEVALRSPSIRAEMGERARHVFDSEFSADVMGAKTLAVYASAGGVPEARVGRAARIRVAVG